MSAVGTAAAWLLASLFAWAAIAKLTRPTPTAAAFTRLGLPRAGSLARAVPVAEAALAVALVARPAIGAAVAFGALAVFSAVLERARRRGLRAACGCFGPGAETSPLSTALLRNSLLAVAALLALAGIPGLPPLSGILVAGPAAVIALTALALWDLRARAGRLWDNRPLGDRAEARRGGRPWGGGVEGTL